MLINFYNNEPEDGPVFSIFKNDQVEAQQFNQVCIMSVEIFIDILINGQVIHYLLAYSDGGSWVILKDCKCEPTDSAAWGSYPENKKFKNVRFYE